MGGGSSGVYDPSSRSATYGNDLRNQANESIKNTEERLQRRLDDFSYSPRNVFISFHTEDEMQVKLLRYQAKDDRFDFSFRDYSVQEPFTDKWKTRVKERIERSEYTLCLIGEETHSRKAVNWELEQSYTMGKKVIGVRIYRDANHKIPEPIKRNKSKVINWNLGDIMEQLSEE